MTPVAGIIMAGIDRPLHVLTLTPFFPSEENEVNGCFVAEPVEQLRQSGVDVSVIAVTPIHYPSRHARSSAPAVWMRFPQIPGNIGLSSAGNFLYARLLQRVRELHGAKPIDVIHAHAALPCGHAAKLLSTRLHIPFVVTVHGLDVWNSGYVSGRPADRRRKVSLDVYRAARTVVCISGKVQEILKAGAPVETDSIVVYNGVDPTLFSPNTVENEPLDSEILIVGNLLRSKGQELVLRAIGTLKTSLPRLRCRVIGEGADRAYLESLARDLGIGPQVEFAGRRNRSEVAEAMRRCSVFALPSRNEGLGCVYLEAMSCGKPSIGCRGQGIDEVIEHGKNGWLVPPDGFEELVHGLSDLLGSRDLRERIGMAARQTILEKFTLSDQAKNLTGIYLQAVTPALE